MSTLKSIIFSTLPDPEEYWETAEALRDLDRQYQHFTRTRGDTGDGSLCSSCVQRGKEVTNHRHLSFYHQRRQPVELPRRGRHQVDPLRRRSAGHRPYP